MEVQLYTDHLLTVSSKCHSHPLTLTYSCRSIESELLATLTITNPQPTKQSRNYIHLLSNFKNKYFKVHVTNQTTDNHTNPQPTTSSWNYIHLLISE